MPKVAKSKFRLSFVQKHIDEWQNKAKELQKTAKRSFRHIRAYVPQYESSMTDTEKEQLIEIISK